MRIVFLCKRQYMSKDVILDRYARLYEIPRQLAELGHTVHAYCFDYHSHPKQGIWHHQTSSGKLVWHSQSAGKCKLPKLLNYPFSLLRQLRKLDPDIIIGSSDIPHVVLAEWLAKKLGRPYAIDLYDNFESFGQARIPCAIQALRHGVRNAKLVTTTSELLKTKILDEYQAGGEVIAMPSSVDLSLFRPYSKKVAREQLGLPLNAKLIGTAGGLTKNRGIDTLYEAWPLIAKAGSDIHLVLAGPIDARYPPQKDPRIHYLGMLPHSKTAALFNALDVGVIYLKDTPFGRYCFPQKAYEMIACQLPLIAANIGAMQDLLRSEPEYLYQADSSADLARAAILQLQQKKPITIHVDDWQQLIKKIEPLLTR